MLQATLRANRTDVQQQTDNANTCIGMFELRSRVSANAVDRLRMERVGANQTQKHLARHNEIRAEEVIEQKMR